MALFCAFRNAVCAFRLSYALPKHRLHREKRRDHPMLAQPIAQTRAPTTLEALIGNTPLLRLQRVTAHLPPEIAIYAKAEWTNPGGSVKDRAALNIIRTAERDGKLRRGMTLVDSTSGNTGIAYAMLGALRGIRVKLFVPANASPERLAILRAYGAELVLTDPLEGSDGAIHAVRQLVQREPDRYFYADQYSNPANWQAHYHSTALEIWRQTDGAITHFIAGLGTTGTFTGTARRLKELKPTLQAIAVQPDSPFHGLEGLKHMPSALQPAIYDPTLADEQLAISTDETYAMARRLACEEGLLVGISAAAATVAALQVAERLAARGQSGVIALIFPDSAYKYLSHAPFAP
jgi:cysteine synthase B